MDEQKQYEKRLIKHGDSICIPIPTNVLRQLKLDVGDEVSILTIDAGIMIRPIEDARQTDIDANFSHEMERIMERHDRTFKGLVGR
ncbi:AbrB/MazE/SpoVT family DNA-binding domain-containing protein [Exiguobacterium sp. TNDT2]|uniref:AbrB/MazE/SpoVT family DNA-binding domain-containing protein n=1 Tax=Exiguobacterium sp. TNDT2 TaxID=2233531 RepID=UPI000DEF21D4|nr:AbrB/MazE/SpoVT family DNA-binding domain-containing protein [Exiguobacterium sp. TNDT2]